MSTASPWQVFALRRRIKKFSKLGVPEGMRALHQLRNMGLDKKMIISTEVTRTLVWASNKTKDYGENE